jgi:pilus assembly protein TadC
MSEGIDKGEGRKGAAALLGGRISCIVGILFALLGASANVSAGAVGAALGVLGYFLGARRLGAVTIVLGVIAVFFMAAAATGLIPGVEPLGHGYD